LVNESFYAVIGIARFVYQRVRTRAEQARRNRWLGLRVETLYTVR